jgi:hypothetical protein
MRSNVLLSVQSLPVNSGIGLSKGMYKGKKGRGQRTHAPFEAVPPPKIATDNGGAPFLRRAGFVSALPDSQPVRLDKDLAEGRRGKAV